MAFFLTPGNIADISAAPDLLAKMPPAERVLADKGYDANSLLGALKAQGTEAVIPSTRSRKRAIPYDVVAVARHLLSVPEPFRAFVLRRLMFCADAADLFQRKSGRRHPLWGDGTLEAVAARSALVQEPFLDDPEYCQCMALVFQTLLEWRLKGDDRGRLP